MTNIFVGLHAEQNLRIQAEWFRRKREANSHSLILEADPKGGQKGVKATWSVFETRCRRQIWNKRQSKHKPAQAFQSLHVKRL